MATQITPDLNSLNAELQEIVAAGAQKLGVPGVAVGISTGGAAQYAFHGVTNIENPLPIDADTLFPINSTGKTLTATAIMCLVDQGLVDLHERVRRYVPELVVRDEAVACDVTVLHLLNHTAGWSGDLFADTGDGDDALERFVAKMAELEQVSPLGATVSYNNASLSLAGRVIEKVTGKTYEQALKELLIQPLRLTRTAFFPVEIMTRRFTVGHTRRPDGSLAVVRPWEAQRSLRPMGVGISMSARDHTAWAHFHLGDGRAPDGTRVLSQSLLERMQEPTIETPGSAFGDAMGISWMLRDANGIRLVSHGGDGGGHHSGFVMVPERNFAFTILTNGLDGRQLRDEMQEWVLARYLGLVIPNPADDAVRLSDENLAEYVGVYEMHEENFEITADAGELVLTVRHRSEVTHQASDADEVVADQFPTLRLGMLPGGDDRYVVTGHPHRGLPGHFVRGPSGAIEALHFGGLLATRKRTVPGSSS